MSAAVVAQPFRKCVNVKSRVNPDIRCPLSATHGDYCSRHYKNPKPYVKPPTQEESRIYTRADRVAVKKIILFWRRAAPLYRFSHQGPAANSLSISVNETELYNFEPIASIPKHYMVSFSDERKNVWVFDIRTIVHTMGTGFPSENPYTRDTFTERAKKTIHGRVAWLRARKYPVLHINTDVVSPEQCWNHKILDIFLKIEALGYYVNCDWYRTLSQIQHVSFYTTIFSMWEYRLGLSRAEKERVVPGHETARLFRFHPNDIPTKSLHWWEKQNLALIEAFISRATEKEQQKMGAMYVLMALTRVSRGASEALPWLAN